MGGGVTLRMVGTSGLATAGACVCVAALAAGVPGAGTGFALVATGAAAVFVHRTRTGDPWWSRAAAGAAVSLVAMVVWLWTQPLALEGRGCGSLLAPTGRGGVCGWLTDQRYTATLPALALAALFAVAAALTVLRPRPAARIPRQPGPGRDPATSGRRVRSTLRP